MCFSSEIENTRKNCKFMFEQPCQCPPNQLEAIKFSKVISGRKGGGQACCLIMCGIFGLVSFQFRRNLCQITLSPPPPSIFSALVVGLSVMIYICKSRNYGPYEMPFILFVATIIVACCVIVCCAAAVGGGHSSLEILYRCSPCGKDTHRTYECFIEVDYFGERSRRYDFWDNSYRTRHRTTYRTRTYSAWGQYTDKVEKMELQQGRMTMKNFEAVERKFDVMSIVQDNYYKTSDDWTDTLIRHLE
ncbi:hypothetical protein niasHS_006151 [Heterodera schachtii]|uniref:Uncharacterized protein n=1 Tax=Heterodera schachtii TaxID=97005 RepID=A0ABD2JW61_HETSC